MLTLQERINAFSCLGQYLHSEIQNADITQTELGQTIIKAGALNPWFTKDNQLMALDAIGQMLTAEMLNEWVSNYIINENGHTVGLIMAGNIPAVGFHDFLTVLLSGRRAVIKPSSSDSVLMVFLAKKLIECEPRFSGLIEFVDKLRNPDAVIATGSDNSALYFEYYFKKIPHLIRKNRNSVAVLSGNETGEDLKKLGKDIFSYFGLGCRNVSKLMVPKGYNFKFFFEMIQPYGESLMQHNKYMNNYDYCRAIYLMEKKSFLTNNFVHLLEDSKVASPVATLYYQHYDTKDDLRQALTFQLEKIQCVVSNSKILGEEVAFGQSQYPLVSDYADGVDTLEFLLSV